VGLGLDCGLLQRLRYVTHCTSIFMVDMVAVCKPSSDLGLVVAFTQGVRMLHGKTSLIRIGGLHPILLVCRIIAGKCSSAESGSFRVANDRLSEATTGCGIVVSTHWGLTATRSVYWITHAQAVFAIQ
jgi:hypothetical protein